MPIATPAALRAALAAPHRRLYADKATQAAGSAANSLVSNWLSAPGAGATPSTAVACNSATVGAIRGLVPGASRLQLIQATAHPQVLDGGAMTRAYVLLDRLSHQGGLSGTTTGAQTTNLPTAPLTRYTDGVGVMIFLEIYGSIGNTGAIASVGYTNSDGTAGRTSVDIGFGGVTRSAFAMLPIPLMDGDRGARSVESVTLSASTATAGNFGVTLARPLGVICVPQVNGIHRSGTFGGSGQLPIVDGDACLMLAQTVSSSAGNTAFEFLLAET